MKRSKKIINRAVAYNAYCYYMRHEIANFSDTANFISRLFNVKYTKDDVGKMFRHIVIFGEIDEMAKKLCHTVNWRSKYDKDFYNRFLGYRYEFYELLKELSECEKIIYEKNQYDFLLADYKNYASSEIERDGYLEDIKKRYDDACTAFDLLDLNYIFKLREKIEDIEKYRIKELII